MDFLSELKKNWQKIWDLLPHNEIKRTQSIRISVPVELPQRPYSPSQRTQSPVQTQSLPTWFLPQSGTRWPRGYRPWWIQKRGCSVHSRKSPLALIISNLSVTVAPTVYLMSYQKRGWIQRRAGGGKCERGLMDLNLMDDINIFSHMKVFWWIRVQAGWRIISRWVLIAIPAPAVTIISIPSKVNWSGRWLKKTQLSSAAQTKCMWLAWAINEAGAYW